MKAKAGLDVIAVGPPQTHHTYNWWNTKAKRWKAQANVLHILYYISCNDYPQTHSKYVNRQAQDEVLLYGKARALQSGKVSKAQKLYNKFNPTKKKHYESQTGEPNFQRIEIWAGIISLRLTSLGTLVIAYGSASWDVRRTFWWNPQHDHQLDHFHHLHFHPLMNNWISSQKMGREVGFFSLQETNNQTHQTWGWRCTLGS